MYLRTNFSWNRLKKKEIYIHFFSLNYVHNTLHTQGTNPRNNHVYGKQEYAFIRKKEYRILHKAY